MIDVEQLDFIPETIRSELNKPEITEKLAAFIESQKTPVVEKNRELLGKLSEVNETIKSLGGLDTLRSLKEQADSAARQAEEERMKSAGVDELKKTYQQQLAERDAQIVQLRAAAVDRDLSLELSKAIREADGVPELLEPHLKMRIKTELVDGKNRFVVLNAAGGPMLRPDGTDAGFGDLLEEFRGSSVFGRAFNATNKTGSGAKETGGSITENPWNPATRNVTKQMELVAKSPQQAVKLAAQYGITLNI